MKKRSLLVCLTAVALLLGGVTFTQQSQLVAETQPPLPMIALHDLV